MNLLVARPCLLGLLVLLLSATPGSARVWTDNLGRKFEAELLEITATSAVFVVNGLRRPIPLKNLSEADLLYLRKKERRGDTGRNPSPRPTPEPSKVRLEGTFAPGAPEMTANLQLPVRMVENDPVERRWVYRTPHFEFISDSFLKESLIRDFSWAFEVTYDYVTSLPVQKPRLHGANQRLRTFIFKNRADYMRAGGPSRSSGVYLPARDAILVPLSSLSSQTVTGGTVVRNRMSSRVLQHEITHYLMRGRTQQAAWFIEGSAEFVASVPFFQNRLLLSRHPGAVVDCITAFGWESLGGYRLGHAIELAPLNTFMAASPLEFKKFKNAYPYSLMVFYFFARLDGKKDGAHLKRYAEMLLEGRPEVEARAVLLDGRSENELQAEFARAWNLQGIKLSFLGQQGTPGRTPSR